MELASGIVIKRRCLSAERIRNITATLQPFNGVSGLRRANHKIPEIQRLVESSGIQSLLKPFFAATPKLVRAILFNKSSAANWSVPWHQDKTIAVTRPASIEGWGPWSEKEGITHVQPTADVLDSMVTLRMHLDNATSRNGCLRAIPNSHRHGLLCQSEIDECVETKPILTCEANAGDIIVMRPHIVHSSCKSIEASMRRIVHLDFSDFPLPQGLEWVNE